MSKQIISSSGKGLMLLMLLIVMPLVVQAGWIEDREGKTIIHVKVWDMPNPISPQTNQRANWAVVKSFVKDFPAIFKQKYQAKYSNNPKKYGKHNWDNVEIELSKFSGISIEGMGMDSKPLMAIAGGVAPDILFINFRQSDTYIQNGFLYPLDKPEDGYFTGMTKAEIDYAVFPKIWPVIKRKGPEGKVHIWAKPTGGILGKVFLYRKDLLMANNIPFPTNDWTWDDLYKACQKITDPSKGIYGIAFSKGAVESWFWVTFLWSAGGDVMTFNSKTGLWSAVFASKAGAEALNFYTKLCAEPWHDKAGKLRFGYAALDSDRWQKWYNGQIGFFPSYIDEKLFSTINPDVTGMVAVPIGPDGKRGGELNSSMQGIFAGVKSRVIRDAAWEYMRYLDGKKATGIRTKVMVEGGLGRFVNPRYLREFGYDNIIRLSPKGWEDTFKIAMDTGKPEPYGSNCQLVYVYMSKPIHEARNLALNGELPKQRKERLAVMQALLKNTEMRVNEKMIGKVPPKKMRVRRYVASILLVVIAITFFILFKKIFKAFTPPEIIGVEKPKWNFKKYFWAYVIIAPAILSVFLWQYLPLIIGSKMAFQDYQIMKANSWVGVDNFANLLWDESWWNSVWNALIYSFLVVCFTFLPPVILAILLDEIPRGKILFRTLFYLPAVITGLVVIYLWKSFYEPSEFGVLNSVVMHIPGIGYAVIALGILLLFFAFARRLYLQHVYWASGVCIVIGSALFIFIMGFIFNIHHQLELTTNAPVSWISALFSAPPIPLKWLDDPQTALLSCVIPMVWMGMGPGCLIYLAALKGIAPDFYEAADIDGATFLDKILFIVLPNLKALLIINFVGVFIASWKSSAFILAMAGQSPNTEVAGLHIFFEAYTRLKFGPATAMAWVLGFMLIWFTVNQLKILSKLEFKTTGNK
ncbi:MAG: extracellular solute-binding protein [Victivallaceae bacterium]|nr:extracellular solute-binding protein [Victivallaceae bacterium]